MKQNEYDQNIETIEGKNKSRKWWPIEETTKNHSLEV